MCIKPLTIQNPGTKWTTAKSIQIPCGKCIECKIRYQNQWMIRLYEEAKCHKHILFITLTYNEQKVPFYLDKNTGQIFRTVYKDHIQKALKRFRINRERHLKQDATPFKYFITSEYGPSTYRPHYHGVIFGLSRMDFLPFLNDWRKNYGFFKCTVVKSFDDRHKLNACRYVAKYCSKGEFECPYVEQGKVNKTFHLISKRLGYGYINKLRKWHLSSIFHRFDSKHRFTSEYLDDILSRKNYQMGSFCYQLPRYYSNKIYGEQSRLSAALSDYQRKKFDDALVRELALIQSQRNCTETEAFNIYTNIQNEIHTLRYSKAKKRFQAFLTKSQI